MSAQRLHFVYRCRTADGEYLYVGATGDVDQRLRTHATTTVWAVDVAAVEITEHDLLVEALRVEKEQIASLRPRWNINGRGHRSTWRLADYVEVMLSIDARREKAWRIENSDAKIGRLGREMSRRFPDVAPQILRDLDPHLSVSVAPS